MVIRKVYRVGEVASRLRNLLEGDPVLNNIWVRGEISNFKSHASGHLYFTLKDETGSLRCVMFRSRSSLLSFLPANGMNVLVRGYVSFYERDGSCQLYVEELTPDGLGSLYLAYCRLKNKLEAAGFFAPERKKPLPFLPRKVGVITSPSGAVWHDLVTVMRRRFPGIPILLAPAAVQGEQAPLQICAALAALNRRTDLDVVIVARGGGSLEELWAFNTEEVARAIFDSRIPVVSAVGHETDYTIADFVADLRAPTPSAAAELVVPSRAELESRLYSLQNRLIQGIFQVLRERRERVRGSAGRNFTRILQNTAIVHKQEVKLLSLRLIQGMQRAQEGARAKVEVLAGKLNSLSPLAILQRGYSLCWAPQTGQVVRSSRQVKKGDSLEVILGEGSLDCRVEEAKEGTPWKIAEFTRKK
ncbi:MAG: exodeoxyribonuclease VII large subunit [Firmicutes bacterium]|nr:exodeoxyribonuclease VII large subunit [Bacillota bacterium]